MHIMNQSQHRGWWGITDRGQVRTLVILANVRQVDALLHANTF